MSKFIIKKNTTIRSHPKAAPLEPSRAAVSAPAQQPIQQSTQHTETPAKSSAPRDKLSLPHLPKILSTLRRSVSSLTKAANKRNTSESSPQSLRKTSLLPLSTLTGRALITVIVIMTFLAALAAGCVELISAASSSWQNSVSREVTLQIRPRQERNIEEDVKKAAEIGRQSAGIGEIRIFSKAEADRLLEPWLGTGLSLEELPVPRLIVLKIADTTRLNLTKLKADLQANLPNASLDDHRLWLSRLAVMANALVLVGLIILALVLIATSFAVGFATRGAMAGNREIIDVLHMVGAEDRFIASEFQSHFLKLGLKGGLIGGALAALFFLAASHLANRWVATPGGDQIEALFGSFSIGARGLVAISMIALFVALLVAFVSRFTVFRNLRGDE